MQHSIALLTCWYGDYPWYFQYFIKSCAYNPTVDFIIITDNTATIPNKPDNVKILFKTFDDFKTNASAKLGFPVAIDIPYKLCDFKPAYGFLFPEILAQYDFWGHGDIDMVYGNIRNFMTEEILDNYDIITPREDIIMGTFCLYRNTEQMNTLFMKSRDYGHVFSNATYFNFDECSFLFKKLASRNSILAYSKNIQSMTYLAVKGDQEGDFKAYFNRLVLQGMSNKIRWDNGVILNKNQVEWMLYDLIKYKVKCQNKTISYPIPDVFYFHKNGINKKRSIKFFSWLCRT